MRLAEVTTHPMTTNPAEDDAGEQRQLRLDEWFGPVVPERCEALAGRLADAVVSG